MSLDLNKLANKLDEALSNETSETLNNFLKNKNMTNETKQTEVEWLEIELEKLWVEKYLSPITIKPLLQQAKEMEKGQMIEFAKNCFDYLLDNNEDCILLTTQDRIEHFYNETYGGNK